MSSKLQDLTLKLYREGVEKAQAEAKIILDDAETKKNEIIAAAKAEAKQIIDNGKKDADQLIAKGKAELELSASQAVSALKQEIIGLLTNSSLSPGLKEALSNKDFIKGLVVDLISKWDLEKQNLDLVLPADKEKEFDAYLKKEISSLLKKGLNVNFQGRMDAGFKIAASDGSFILSFTDADFERYFQSFVKDKTRAILFPGK